MSSYDDEKTNLKSIFGDNKYPNGNNFAELINLPDFRLAENNDGTITVNNVTYDMTKSDLGSIAQISEDFNNLPNGLTFVSNGQNNAPEPTHAYWVRTFNSSAYGGRKLQVAQADSSNNRYIRTYTGIWNNWGSLVTDNMDGSITVNGATFIPADNSKVAHLSGANNFDTTPTVNNNPLLLASSLPSDLARTGSDQEFMGKNTFDTAPIDKATGNPYITKDGVPSDVARTGQSQTFTAAQTFSIAPVINDASTSKGDNQAATMADLKSVKASAWRQLTGSNTLLSAYNALLKLDESSNTGYITIFGTTNNVNTINNDYKIIDLGSIVTGLSDITGSLAYNIDFASANGTSRELGLMINGDSIYLQHGGVQYAQSGMQCSTFVSNTNIVSFKYENYVGA